MKQKFWSYCRVAHGTIGLKERFSLTYPILVTAYQFALWLKGFVAYCKTHLVSAQIFPVLYAINLAFACMVQKAIFFSSDVAKLISSNNMSGITRKMSPLPCTTTDDSHKPTY